MTRARWIVALALLGAFSAGSPVASRAGSLTGSALALPLVDPSLAPGVTVLQRTITREWGLSEDSTYTEVSIPGYKSEGWAAMMSAAVPGAGQYYVGESSAVWFALAEAAGWTAYAVFNNRASQAATDAKNFAGNPDSSTSNWSFERWAQHTGNTTDQIQALYAGDPSAFYHLIGHNDTYLSGWVGDPNVSRSSYRDSYDSSQRDRQRSHYATGALWLNHLLAAVDALRAARVHNMTLGSDTRLNVHASWHNGPAVRATLERRF